VLDQRWIILHQLPGTVRIRDASPIATAEQRVKLESAHRHVKYAGLWDSVDPLEETLWPGIFFESVARVLQSA
jgi:hypothetical protein